MKTILDIIILELLGKKIKSVENTGGSTYEMTLRIDKIFGYKNGHLKCEVTIYAKEGGKRSGMITTFDFDNWEYEIINNQKYLVRPSDFHIWEIDPSNGCYRSYINMDVLCSDGTRPNAQKSFTFENLTKNYDFFTIEESELEIYEQKHKNVLNNIKMY